MRLVIWHFDPYPTAPGVYLGVFPRRGHRVVWVESTVGERGGVRRWQEGGVERWEVARRRDAKAWRPLAMLHNRASKLAAFVRKVRLLWRLAATRPDALQVRELVSEGVAGWLAAKRFGVPFFFQFDYPHYEARLHEWDRTGRTAIWGRLTARWWMRWRDFLLRHSDLSLPISEAMVDRLVQRLGLDERRLAAFPVGIDQALWRELGDAPVLPLEGLDSGRPVVAYMGNLAPIRDPGFLLDVVEEILGGREDAQFLLIARVPPEVERRLEGSRYRPRMHLVGFRPRREALQLLRHADVGLFPLPVVDPYGVFYTSSPLKVIEYLSAGVPVVSSRNGDADALLAESGGGISVANEVEAFAAAALQLLANPERAKEMGRRGRTFVGAHRTFEALAERVEAAYRRVLPGAPEGFTPPGEGGPTQWAS